MGIRQMIRNRQQQRNEQRDGQWWWPQYVEMRAADQEAEEVIARAHQAERDDLAGDAWLQRYNQIERDEEEAYRRNAEMGRAELQNPEIEANDDYLSWLDDEGWGQESGNPRTPG
jgi:hypothetical protein